jgi:hypothetical protein
LTRQIRNAFQTAIALVEAEAEQTDPSQPKPILGKLQFELVAEGSREFDSYLMESLQGANDNVATNFDESSKTAVAAPLSNLALNTSNVSLQSASSSGSDDEVGSTSKDRDNTAPHLERA